MDKEWLVLLGVLAVAGVVWVGRILIPAWITRRVQHDFEARLENLRAEIRRSDAHIEAVRATALSAVETGQAALNQRRLQAVDDLWRSMMLLKSSNILVTVVEMLDHDKVVTNLQEPGMKQFLNSMGLFGQGFVERLKGDSASTCRPHVSPMAWVLYSAYSAIVVRAHLKFETIRSGLPSRLLREDTTLEIVRTALPNRTAELEKRGTRMYPDLLTELEERVLVELRASVEGKQWDAEGLDRARKIARLAAEGEQERATAATKAT